ncbi:NAD(P)H-hydrate epimerase, partial [Pseudomonas viridiflava]|uniref:NAD(P)H-hydrate epimerase n=1 Tax=Pseudomonas viridiflava TaxID=33069 RepID=UPI0023DD7F77
IQPWANQAMADIVVDALLGAGLQGDVRNPYRSAIEAINASGLPVAAVDIPSGLCADTGHCLVVAVRADLTVTFIGLKMGMPTGDAPDLIGLLIFDDL